MIQIFVECGIMVKFKEYTDGIIKIKDRINHTAPDSVKVELLRVFSNRIYGEKTITALFIGVSEDYTGMRNWLKTEFNDALSIILDDEEVSKK